MIKKVLTKEGLLIYDTEKYITIQINREETEALLNKKIDFGRLDYHPRVVHMEISDTCDFGCKYCYNKEMNRIKGLSTEQWKKIIEDIGSFGVFEITFGGGETFENPDIIKLAHHVKKNGMTVAVTTNGKYLKNYDGINVFDQINLSYHENSEVFEQALKYLSEKEIRIGINFLLSKPMLKHIKYAVAMAKKYNAELLLLAYKPMLNDYENQIPPDHCLKIAKWISKNVWSKVAVDGMAGMKCVASQYFCDVNSIGRVFQCSFVRLPIGDLTKQSFREIWENRKSLIKCPFVNDNCRNDLYNHIGHNPAEKLIKLRGENG